jgi:hypothetical protein
MTLGASITIVISYNTGHRIDKHSSLFLERVTYKQKGFIDFFVINVLFLMVITFTTLHFLTYGSNRLECYITLKWKGLLVSNTLAYWA